MKNLVKIRVWQLTTAQSHCRVCVTSSWSAFAAFPNLALHKCTYGNNNINNLALQRISPIFSHSRRLLSPDQAGFRKGRSTCDQVAALTTLIENGFQQNLKTGAVFLDFTAAYDTVWHTAFFTKVSKSMPYWFTRLVGLLLRDGRFAPLTFRLFTGRFAPWTFRHLDVSFSMKVVRAASQQPGHKSRASTFPETSLVWTE